MRFDSNELAAGWLSVALASSTGQGTAGAVPNRHHPATRNHQPRRPDVSADAAKLAICLVLLVIIGLLMFRLSDLRTPQPSCPDQRAVLIRTAR